MHHSNETFLAKCLQSTIIYLIGQIGFTMTDIGEGPGPGPSIFLDQTEARRAKRKFFWRLPNPLTAPPPPPHQRVWMTGLNPALFKTLLFESNIIVIHINFLQYVVYYSSIDH